MARIDQHVHTEWRGGTCRVKWWSGEYLPNGRKRYESKGGFTDETLAYEHGQNKLYEIRHGTHVKNRDGATSMSDWLDDWLAGMNHGHLTERVYRSVIETHIRPYFKKQNASVADVDVLAYRAFKKHIYAKMRKASSADNVVMVLGMVLDDAVPRLIRTSPVERTRRRGKYKKKPKERKKDMTPEAVEQLACNARAVLGKSGYALIWTMAVTGMRPGELYGLTREYCYPNWPLSDPRPDVDETERYEEDAGRYGRGDDRMPAIRVERQVQYADGTLQFFPPKYESQRTLVVPQFLADLLKDLLESHDSEWVFPAAKGGSLGVANFNYKYWRPIADGAVERSGPRTRGARPALDAVQSFKGRRLYLVRHGHKAWLDEDGHSRFAVESRMGHEVPGVEGVYSSVTVPMERAIMKTLQERWEGLQEGLTGREL
ncbi:tyrosine-type recombinase/integrase [Streptomyces californicus]|uniref:tyrosine-type recombinase/integrase n=1 Tax=Streptomyces californicus TaxID=67351 RepID=UPI0037FBED43